MSAIESCQILVARFACNDHQRRLSSVLAGAMDFTGDANSMGIDHSALSNILEDFARDPETLKRLRDATINAYDVDDCTDSFL